MAIAITILKTNPPPGSSAIRAGCALALVSPVPNGIADRIGHAQGHRGQALAERGLVQAGAQRTPYDRGSQRRGEDDAAADAGGGDVDRQGRAEPGEGSAAGAARPAPAARAGEIAA